MFSLVSDVSYGYITLKANGAAALALRVEQRRLMPTLVNSAHAGGNNKMGNTIVTAIKSLIHHCSE